MGGRELGEERQLHGEEVMYDLIVEGFDGGTYVASCLNWESLRAAMRLLDGEQYLLSSPEGKFLMTKMAGCEAWKVDPVPGSF
jgi:hypothetical protein